MDDMFAGEFLVIDDALISDWCFGYYVAGDTTYYFSFLYGVPRCDSDTVL